MSLLTLDRLVRQINSVRVYAVEDGTTFGYVAECTRCLTSSELYVPARDAHEDAIRDAICEVEHDLVEDCAAAVLRDMKTEMDALNDAFDRLLSGDPNADTG